MMSLLCQLRQKIELPSDKQARTAAVELQNQLWRACQAIRRRDLDLAETLLRTRPMSLPLNATYWNLMGLLAEAQGDWNTARRHWQRALRTNRHHSPAERNLRRYFEFYEWGWSEYLPAFGDEIEYGILRNKELSS
jgi:tetratricopeptide (TPR) repeat protein